MAGNDDEQFDAAVREAVAMATAEQKVAALERLRRSVVRERRWWRVATGAALVVGCLAINLALNSQDLADRAQESIDATEASRADARVASCLAANDQQERNITANKEQVRQVFASLTSDDDLTVEERESLDRLFAEHDAVIDANYPIRDCTETGLDAYFDQDPDTDPYVPVKESP